MPPFLTRRSSVPTCFFCLSAVSPAPPDSRSYRCRHCGCWNRFDANGEISSEEPAMHDQNLNTTSFAMRASQNKDTLPSAYTNPPFCHTCQTNQMLLLNLLSNYLPSQQASSLQQPHATTSIVSQHPDYAQRLEQLPAYRDSLHSRYPPVCPNCLPAVENEIEQKNQMARTRALGRFLQESRGKERPGSEMDRERLALQLAVWRVRGALWWSTLLSVVVAHTAAVRGYDFPHFLARIVPALPVFSLFSLFYTAWDPTYYRFKRAKVQGRDVRIRGRTRYIILQLLSWLSRFTTSVLLALSPSWDLLRISAYPSSHRVSTYCSASLVMEMLVFSSSFTILHLRRPPAIRLIETSSIRDTPELSAHSPRVSPMPTVPIGHEPDLLASLTLSAKPLFSSTNPIFGHSSLSSPSIGLQSSPIKIDENPDEDAMDWSPSISSPIKVKNTADDDGAWLRPQRFFPPERPTGLESLFANTKLDDGEAHATKPTTLMHECFRNAKVIGWWIATIAVLVVPVVLYRRWMRGWI